MVVRAKPKNVEEFIESGGSTPPPTQTTSKTTELTEEVKGLKLRIPAELLDRVDEVVSKRRPAPSRHQWILEAIYEKLDREVSE